jgi:hypothetical protein
MSGSSMAAPVVSGTIALMLEANPSLTPNMAKAILQYTAESRTDVHRMAQGAGFLNSFGAINLAARFANPNYPLLTTAGWSRHLLWGNHLLSGGTLSPTANAWALNIVWGTLSRDGDNIVWGTIARDGDNIVWGTIARDGDNIVWGTIAEGDNIVWGTLTDGDNIVWGTLARDGDNIVWGTTAGAAENVVWGTDCDGANCSGVVWGTLALDGDNIVWGTIEQGDNIVWGTMDGDNIVWGTAADGDNIVWGTSDDDNLVWGTSDLTEELGTSDPLEAVEMMFESLFTPVVSDGTVGGIL